MLKFLPLIKLLARHPRALFNRNLINWSYLSDDVCRRDCQRFGFPEGLPTVDLLSILPGFCETVEPYSYLEGTSRTIDLALLKALARRKDCRYLEIGTWRGESLANVASVAPHCVSVSLSAREMRQMGLSDAFIENHSVFCRDVSNITVIPHNSQTLDFSKLGKFDLMFVDGDHSY